MGARIARAEELDPLLEIRRVVFVVGQDVPPELEVDGLDPECVHFAVEDGAGRLVGTARMRSVHGIAKAERVAVLDEARGHGYGRDLMLALEAEAARRGFPEVLLYAQVQVLPFYERLGYVGEGEIFEDAGIDHRAMRKRLG